MSNVAKKFGLAVAVLGLMARRRQGPI